jgi:pSer/pThr/pTyr-binding forkhead associated (FHA) protein
MEVTAYLKIIEGPGTGTIWEVGPTVVVLGRYPDNDIQVADLCVDRHHAKIHCTQDEFFLEDCDSRSGTYLNNQHIRGQQKIGEGDQIRVGQTTFAFHQYGVSR